MFAKKTCPLIEEREKYKGRLLKSDPFIFSIVLKGDIKMRETGKGGFQEKLKKELKQKFPGCIVTKLDSSDTQGIPDLLILYKNKWATLENKRSVKAKKQPNQEYYVDKMNKMSFSRFIYPENKETVLEELDKMFNEEKGDN